MIVALGAFQRRAEPDGTGGVDAVDDLIDAAFFGLGTGFNIGRRAAVEAGGDDLSRGGIRQEVAGDLLQRELIEGHVRVQGVDHPVAVGPDLAEVIALKAVGVRVACEVQPRARPAHAELLGCQQ